MHLLGWWEQGRVGIDAEEAVVRRGGGGQEDLWSIPGPGRAWYQPGVLFINNLRPSDIMAQMNFTNPPLSSSLTMSGTVYKRAVIGGKEIV